jgi:hypothetical protein
MTQEVRVASHVLFAAKSMVASPVVFLLAGSIVSEQHTSKPGMVNSMARNAEARADHAACACAVACFATSIVTRWAAESPALTSLAVVLYTDAIPLKAVLKAFLIDDLISVQYNTRRLEMIGQHGVLPVAAGATRQRQGVYQWWTGSLTMVGAAHSKLGEAFGTGARSDESLSRCEGGA